MSGSTFMQRYTVPPECGIDGLRIELPELRIMPDSRYFAPKDFYNLRRLWGRSWRISFSAPSEASLIKGRFGGIVYMVADSSAKRTKKAIIFRLSLCVERKTRLCPSALHFVYQAITFAQYYTPNSRDTWEGSGCRFRVRLLPYKLQNYSCLRQIYE